MVEHTDPTVLQSWLIAIPTILTALSTWYLRRGTKKSHAQSEAKTTEKLDSYNGAIKDKIEELEAEIKALKETVTKSRDCQILLAQKYTDSMNSLQSDLSAARRALERSVPADGAPIAVVGEAGKPGAVAAAPASGPGTKAFGEVKIAETPQAPVGKVIWKKEGE